jgi:hypothetical protein
MGTSLKKKKTTKKEKISIPKKEDPPTAVQPISQKPKKSSESKLENQQLSKFAFITKIYKCRKCKYKKVLKKPQTFNPTPEDLICPKCNSELRLSK